jgi:hypothetical protein
MLDKAIVLTENGVLVLLDTRLPSGWKITVGGLAVSPVPKDERLEAPIKERCTQLTDERRANPSFVADIELWPTLFEDERQAVLGYFVGPYLPSHLNRREHRQWWYGRTIKLVLAYYGYVHPTPQLPQPPGAPPVVVRVHHRVAAGLLRLCAPNTAAWRGDHAPRIFGGATTRSSSSCTPPWPQASCSKGSSWHGRSTGVVPFW